MKDANADTIGWHRANSTVTYPGCQNAPGCGCMGTHPVGQKQKNSWGLYDMAGNVYEWCNDWYQSDLGSSAVTNPWGASSGSERVLRGGAWHTPPEWIRAALRVSQTPTVSFNTNKRGFRCARTNP